MSNPKWRRWMRLRGPNPGADVDEEFAFHMEERIETLVARGMSPDDARAQARAQFGDMAGATRICTEIGERRADRIRWTERLDSVLQDLRYAAAAMRRAPGFTAATVLTITLGVGANTVVFSLLNALLFQPLDVARPEELVRVYTSESIVRDDRDRFGGSSYADFADLRQSPTLADLAAFMPYSAAVTRGGVMARYEVRAVSDNFFAVIGKPLYRGGWTGASNDEVIVTHTFWRTALASNPAAIGEPITVNGRSMRIAGITAEDFRGIEPSKVDFYIPLAVIPAMASRSDFLSERGQRSLKLIGRLAPGATPDIVERDLARRMATLATSNPATNKGRQAVVRSARSIIPPELSVGPLYSVATLVFAATVIMLLIAGVNVAAVLLSRTVRRRREIAVRLSLGASRGRIARQLITESVLLAGLSSVLVVALVASLPVIGGQIGMPEAMRPQLDLQVLGYALGVAIAVGVLFGIAPALAGTRADVVDALRVSTGDARATRNRTQRGLVVAQLAMSMLLLVVGSALLRSLDRQQRIDPGFRPGNLLIAQFEDPSNQVSISNERAFTKLAFERLSRIPAIRSMSVASMAPLTGSGFRSTIHIPGYIAAPGEKMDIATVTGGPDLFRTLGIPILRGRELSWSEADTNPKVVVNELMARRYWAGRDPVGSFVRLGGRDGTMAQVIGVSGNARFYSLAESPVPLYVIQRTVNGGGTVLLRTADDPARLIPAVQGMMGRNENPLILAGLQTMDDALHSSLIASRLVSGVIVGVGLVAVCLAVVGLYGVVSYSMAGRSREFGVRMALGASRESIMRLVVGYGLRLAAMGAVIGLALGVAATYLMRSLLFGGASAAGAFIVVPGALVVVTLLASLIPARRATLVGPAEALRNE